MNVNNTKIRLVSEKENLYYWEEFYKKFKLDEESSFCKYIKNEINKNTTIIDIGCGTGRDTRSFSKAGYRVVGIDRSEEAISSNNNHLKEIGENGCISFKVIDISDGEELSTFISGMVEEASFLGNQLLIYTRFFLHSINRETEEILLRTITNSLNSGDMFAAEFRTIEDQSREKVYNDHYRRYVDSELLVNELEQKYSFEVIEYSKGVGFSVFKNEDPFLARVIAKKV
ncbi:class I SAM-dependent methyltransferase [Peribacillus asahii]|uniref:class I SAM-dependent methyltransferase n=1 Tax=Peribacillus asahii TaxID=228899 RepID=UPI00382B3FAD